MRGRLFCPSCSTQGWAIREKYTLLIVTPLQLIRLRDQAAREGLDNLFSEVREAEETVVCEGCADYVFFGIDLHDFEDPAQVLLNAKKMLRPHGHLIDLDWKDESMDFGPPQQKRFSIDKARYLIESAGFTIASVTDAGPYHYLIIASR